MSTPGGPLVAVKLTPVGRAQTFVLGDQPAPRAGDRVVVESDGAAAIGTVVHSIPQLDDRRRPTGEAPPRIVRVATREDIVARMKQQHREQEAYRIALLKIRERGLGMKLARVEQSFDGSQAAVLLHRRWPRRFPRAGPRAGGGVPHADRDAPDRRARRGENLRRLRHLRPAAVLHDVPAFVRAGLDQDGQAAGLEPQPVEAVRIVRAAEVLPALRAAERERGAARRLRQRRRV